MVLLDAVNVLSQKKERIMLVMANLRVHLITSAIADPDQGEVGERVQVGHLLNSTLSTNY